MSTTNVDNLDRVLAAGEITEAEYAERLESALAADAENTRLEAEAEAQRPSGILTGPKLDDTADKARKERNSAACVFDLDAGVLTVDLSTLAFGIGSSGKVSGHATLYLGTKQVGSVLINAPADMDKTDKAQSAEARKLMTMQAAAMRRGDMAGAKNYLDMADAAQARFDAAKNAAKLDWTGKPVIEALHHVSAQ